MRERERERERGREREGEREGEREIESLITSLIPAFLEASICGFLFRRDKIQLADTLALDKSGAIELI